MKQRMHLIVPCCVLMAAGALLLAVLFVLPIHASGGVMLRPPFDGTYRTTAYFDHDEPSYAAGADGYIQIYNGERVPSSYANKTGEPYPYDGHDGWDWSMITGTNVLAAAAGTVVVAEWGNWGGYGRTIVISHSNGYYTVYAHLDQLLVGVGDSVTAGQHIAESGATPQGTPAHLHFGVRHGGWTNTTYAVDPFGWRGEGRDPLSDYNGKVSTCLWRSRDEDPISCADTIVEDAGRGSTIAGTWLISTLGNGYHMYYRRNTTESTIYATWLATTTVGGVYKVYAYIPSQNATTRQATYQVWTASGWVSRTIDQLRYSDVWVLLGTYRLPANYAYVVLSANTGEPANTTWVAADAIKFRSYLISLPLVLKCWPAILPATPVLNSISNPTHSPNYTVSWQPASGAETYTLQEATNPNFTGAITVYTGAGTSWTATNKPVGTYYYRVRATNCAGNSGWSNVRSTVVSPPGWITIASQNFEGAFPGNWQVWDGNRSNYGEYYWGKRTCRPYAGSYSGWGVGGGAQGSALSCGSIYPHNADSWMMYGPFSLRDAAAGELRFKLRLSTEPNDEVFWGASVDGKTFYGYAISASTWGWGDQSLDFTRVPTLNNILGQPHVWVALVFSSDGAGARAEGGYVDDILVRLCYRDCPTGNGMGDFGNGAREAVMVRRYEGTPAVPVPVAGPQPFTSPLFAPEPFCSPLPVPEP